MATPDAVAWDERELERRIEARAQELAVTRERRRATVPADVRRRLALAPLWTVPLAERAGLASPGAGPAFVEWLRAEGVCEAEAAPELGGTLCFWLTAAARAAAQAEATEPGLLAAELAAVGRAVADAIDGGTPAPPALARWAAIAARADRPSDAAGLLRARVEALVADVHPGRDAVGAADAADDPQARERAGEALRWVEAGREVERVVRGELTATVAGCGRRIELFHRRAADRRSLRRFLERAELTAAFDALLAAPDAEWGLHFVGVGGVGKTMLMRHLGAVVAPRRGLASARIDFDYISPDYPSRAPALLLAQLVQELRLHADDSTARLFSAFGEGVTKLHERVGARGTSPGESALAIIDGGEFTSLLHLLAEALGRMPRAVLLLDTCEELAKLEVTGRVPANVAATFRILERLHELVPSLRVVFCGRRLLASAGAGGWAVERSPHPARPYLRLHQVRGFTAEEARRLLTERATVPDDAVPAILERSADVGERLPVRWGALPERAGGAPPADDGPRYNPFELALYADWVTADPELAATALAAGTLGDAGEHQYVEMRIVGRIHHPPLRALLPAVALLGRFDEPVVRVLARAPDDVAALVAELAEQEWVDRGGDGWFVVHPRLARRLRAYFAARHRDEVGTACREIARHLTAWTTERPWAELAVAHFDGALRALDEEPARAAAWWRRVEARLAEDAEWERAAEITRQLLADEDARLVRGDGALRAAITATHAAALLHTAPGTDLRDLWRQVERDVERHPDPDGAHALRVRARAALAIGIGTADADRAVAAIAPLLHGLALDPARDPQLVASALAAVEDRVARHEDAGTAPPPALAGGMTDLASAVAGAAMPVALARLAYVLAARLQVLHGEHGRARAWFERALLLAPERGQRWLDWVAPDDASARARLEAVVALYPAALDPAATTALLDAGDSRMERYRHSARTHDGDRYASARLGLHAAAAPPGEWARRLERLLMPANDAAVPWARAIQSATGALAELPYFPLLVRSASLGAPRRVRVHEDVPPFFAAALEDEARAARVGLALAGLDAIARFAERRSDALHTVEEAERARLRIARRFRLRDEGVALTSRITHWRDAADLDAQLALDALGTASRTRARIEQAFELVVFTKSRPPEMLPTRRHVAWRTLSFGPGYSPAHAVELASRVARATGVTAAVLAGDVAARDAGTVAFALDLVEANLLAGSIGGEPPAPDAPPAATVVEGALAWARAHPHEPDAALRLLLRARALGGASDLVDANEPALAALAARLGPARAADAALDEGELLALRLPAAAIPVLRAARVWHGATGHQVGAAAAALAAALATVRAGALDRLRDHVEAVAHYWQTVDDGAPWKGAQPVLAAARGRDATALARALDAVPREWRPWTVRWAACALAADASPGYQELRDWVREHYGARLDDGRVAFPTELEGWLAAPPWLPPAGQRQGGERAGRQRSVMLQVDRPRPPAAAPPRPPAARADDPPRPARPSTKTRLRHLMLEARAAGGGSRDSLTEPILATLVLAYPAGDDAVGYSQPASHLFDPATPYTRIAGLLAGNLGRVIAGAAESPVSGRPFEVRVDEVSAAVAWEAVVPLAAGDGAPAGAHRAWRAVIDPQTRGGAWDRDALHVASVADDPRLDFAVLAAWEPHARTKFVVRPVGDAKGPPATLVHLVGTAVETASGVRFRSAGADRRVQGASPDLKTERGELWTAQELAARFEHAACWVVQRAPHDFPDRTRADREKAALARVFGAQLARLGVRLVLVAPPVPERHFAALAGVVAERLARVERLAPPAAAELLDAVRAFVRETEGLDAEARLEAAFDACAYTRFDTID